MTLTGKIRVTRRAWAGLAAGAAAVMAQSPQTPALPANADEELAAARTSLKTWADQINKVKLAVEIEPAAHFKA